MKSRRWYLGSGALLLAMVCISWLGCSIGYTISGSVPPGFYGIHTISDMSGVNRGDYVAFCLSPSVALIGKKAGYLEHGNCSYGTEKLIKKVIALPGDTVQLSDSSITVNGKTYTAPVLETDRNHHVIRRLVNSGTVFTARRVWVYGDGDTRHSWDSRYYGGVSPQSIQEKMTPLLTFL